MTTASFPTSFHPITMSGDNIIRKTPPPQGSTNGSFMLQDECESYSPTPGADMSSHSSPGSASDHMGSLPSNPQLNNTQSYTGSSALAAFDSNNNNNNHQQDQKEDQHVNRVITTTTGPSKDSKGAGDSTKTTTSGKGQKTVQRRQKRLQRNRESARLSRRRRKQYLEVLEERVMKMSQELDQSRRIHVTQVVDTIRNKRNNILLYNNNNGAVNSNPVQALDRELSRTSPEFMLVTTFIKQQLKSLSIPPAIPFTFWLTLQTETFFRGGRGQSERLSAARIGERMLTGGTNKAAPSQSMWPLFCNEVGLSYDQEERVRTLQKQLLQDKDSWLHRHTAYATKEALNSIHDAVQAVTLRTGQRERSTLSILSDSQRMNLLAWSARNRDRVAHSTSKVPVSQPSSVQRELSENQHVAANMYILKEKMDRILIKIPRAAPLVTGIALKRLSRRACLESLGSADEKYKDMISHTNSSGSLKRNASEMSMDNDDDNSMKQGQHGGSNGHNNNGFSPVDAGYAAAPVVEEALGFVKDLWPKPPAIVFEQQQPATAAMLLAQSAMENDNTAAAPAVPPPPEPTSFASMPLQAIPEPTPVISSSLGVPNPVLSYQAPREMVQSAPQFGTSNEVTANNSRHERKSSFLPLNVVPEELWPNDDADDADAFLLDMMESDWAIGEGIDMEKFEQ